MDNLKWILIKSCKDPIQLYVKMEAPFQENVKVNYFF